MASVAFTGGPADGVEVGGCQRHPVLLRVVTGADTKTGVDVLDQLEDDPREGEAVHVYVRTGTVFACGRPGGGQHSHYRHAPDVDGEALRDREAWQRWAQSDEAAELLPEHLR